MITRQDKERKLNLLVQRGKEIRVTLKFLIRKKTWLINHDIRRFIRALDKQHFTNFYKKVDTSRKLRMEAIKRE